MEGASGGDAELVERDVDLVLLRYRLSPLCGYITRLAALFDNPEVFVFLDHFFDGRFNVDGCVPGRDGEALRSRANLLPFPSG
jgi:hypothetical protein